jgi:glucose uptake protein
MLCWGSWGNTQKLASKSWRYELFYWDYVIGMLLFSLVLAFTMGSIGDQGRPFLQDISQVTARNFWSVILGGVISMPPTFFYQLLFHLRVWQLPFLWE